MSSDRKRIGIFLFALSATLVVGVAQLALENVVEMTMKNTGWENNILA